MGVEVGEWGAGLAGLGLERLPAGAAPPSRRTETAIAEAARPVTRSAVSTGPSSRINTRPTTAPSEPSAPKRDRL